MHLETQKNNYPRGKGLRQGRICYRMAEKRNATKTAEFYTTFKELTPILLKPFQKQQKRENFTKLIL